MDSLPTVRLPWCAALRRTRELYGFRFADVTLVFPDYNDFELESEHAA